VLKEIVSAPVPPQNTVGAGHGTEVKRVVSLAAGDAGLRVVIDAESIVAQAADDHLEVCLGYVEREVVIVDIDADVAALAAVDDGILPAEEDEIVAGPAEELVRVLATVDRVVATVAVERVVILATRQVVVIVAAVEFVVTAAAIQDVVAGSPGKRVVADAGPDDVDVVVSGQVEVERRGCGCECVGTHAGKPERIERRRNHVLRGDGIEIGRGRDTHHLQQGVHIAIAVESYFVRYLEVAAGICVIYLTQNAPHIIGGAFAYIKSGNGIFCRVVSVECVLGVAMALLIIKSPVSIEWIGYVIWSLHLYLLSAIYNLEMA